MNTTNNANTMHEDGLKFASESIQHIAFNAIQAIERLYAYRFQEPMFPTNTDHRPIEPMYPERRPIEPMVSETRAPRTPITPGDLVVKDTKVFTDNREPLVDNNLHNLML